MSYDSRLPLPFIKWVVSLLVTVGHISPGPTRPSDLISPPSYRKGSTKSDLIVGKVDPESKGRLGVRPQVTHRTELEAMLEFGFKAELEALNADQLAEYVTNKLRIGAWL